MKDNYVDMEHDYVNKQDNYVDMQLIINYIGCLIKLHVDTDNRMLAYLLIDWIVLYAVSAIFQPYNGGSTWLCCMLTYSNVAC